MISSYAYVTSLLLYLSLSITLCREFFLVWKTSLKTCPTDEAVQVELIYPGFRLVNPGPPFSVYAIGSCPAWWGASCHHYSVSTLERIWSVLIQS